MTHDMVCGMLDLLRVYLSHASYIQLQLNVADRWIKSGSDLIGSTLGISETESVLGY